MSDKIYLQVNTSQMRLLFLSPLYPPQTGGTATFARLLLPHLKKSDVLDEIYILTEYAAEAPLIEKDRKVTVYRLLAPRDRGNDAHPFLKIIYFLLAQFTLLLLLPWFVLSKSIDAIHINAYFTGDKRYGFQNPLQPLLEKLPVPLIFDIQENFSLPETTRPYRFLFSNSEQIKEGIISRANPDEKEKGKILKIPYLFELPEVKEPPEELTDQLRKPYLCYVGTITEQKGVYELRDGFVKTEASEAGFSLAFVGQDNTSGHFPASLETESNIFYFPPLPYSEVLSFIEQAELLVLASFSEGLPRVCLESIALETKFLYPRGIKEFDEHCPEWGLEEITPTVIANKIDEVLGRKNLPDYPLEQHYPENVVPQIISLYKQAAGEEPANE